MNANAVPGVRAATEFGFRQIMASGRPIYLHGGIVIDGDKARDPLNTGNVDTLRAGLLMGKITSGGLWAPSVIGVTSEAIDNTETAVDLPAAVATELTRRVGASGTFKLVGPPTAAGTVRTVTATYSGFADADTVTITAMGVNEVQTVEFAIASTAGTIALELWDPRTENYVKVEAAAWSATDATYLSNIQAKLDLAFGAANVVVVSAKAATDTDSALVFTYSGATVTGLSVAKLPIVTTLPTSSTSYTTTRTTAGVDGRFVTGSLVVPADGSETIRGILGTESGLKVTDSDGTTNLDVECGRLIIGSGDGVIDASQILNYPADASAKEWIKAQLRALGQGYVFDDDFNG
jgi:hypothetical protein